MSPHELRLSLAALQALFRRLSSKPLRLLVQAMQERLRFSQQAGAPARAAARAG